ncbi:MAG: LuxR C-terminal-related transcriptional regulator [Dermatophilaceae bacterium]
MAVVVGISEQTVRVHPAHVFRRIGVTDRTSAAMWARQNWASPAQTDPQVPIVLSIWRRRNDSLRSWSWSTIGAG